MICPYCGEDMNPGVIGSAREVIFTADNAKRKLGIFHKYIKVTGIFDSGRVAYHCEKCEKIVIDMKKDET